MFKISRTQLLTSRCTQFGLELAKKGTKVKLRFVYWMREYLLSPILLAVFSLALIVLPEKKQKVSFSPNISKRLRLRIKRIAEMLISAICLILFAPVFLTVAILIWLDSPGPIIYKQVRVGQNRRKMDGRRLNFQVEADRRNGDRRKYDMLGRPFYIYKFRTMVDGAEERTGPVWAKHQDPRITKIGRVLRKKRLDELPQFFNVLMGHMSLVGPRPERYHFIQYFSRCIKNYKERFWLKPGITGLAQVSAGYDYSTESVKIKTKYDLQYIRHWHMTEDLIIILKTVAVMLNGKGAA
ncbi:MAG: sugar transferase [candidate division Zixibacteria bacterium]|nr:sugar transferase [candidate division Zixibacteria bacterium]